MTKKKPKTKKRPRVAKRTPARRKDLFVEKLRRFIIVLSHCGCAADAAREADIDYSTVWKHKRNDVEFADAWDEAMEIATDLLEGEGFRRAMKGVKEHVVTQKGLVLDEHGQPLMITRYSDTLLIFLLKGRRRATYGDTIKHQGDQENPLIINGDGLTREELLAEIAATSERLGIAGLLAAPANPGNDKPEMGTTTRAANPGNK